MTLTSRDGWRPAHLRRSCRLFCRCRPGGGAGMSRPTASPVCLRRCDPASDVSPAPRSRLSRVSGARRRIIGGGSHASWRRSPPLPRPTRCRCRHGGEPLRRANPGRGNTALRRAGGGGGTGSSRLPRRNRGGVRAAPVLTDERQSGSYCCPVAADGSSASGRRAAFSSDGCQSSLPVPVTERRRVGLTGVTAGHGGSAAGHGSAGSPRGRTVWATLPFDADPR